MRRFPSGVVDQYIYFVAVDATDLKTRETGLTGFTVRRSRNGGASAAYTTPTINETDVTNMPGVYELLLDEDMTIDSGDVSQEVCLHITQASMAPVTLVFELFRPDVTAGNTLAVDSSGIGDANVQEWLGTAAAAPTTAGVPEVDVTFWLGTAAQGASGRPQVDLELWLGSAPNALVSGRVDSSVGAMAANVLTATAINADAFTAAKFAADVGAEFADAVWDEDATGHQTQGTFGQAIGDPVADADTIWGILNAIGSTGSGLTAIPWNPSWDAEVQSEVQDAIEVNHLDHLLAVTYDPASKPGVADALLNELVESDGGVARYTANALEQAPTGGGSDPWNTALPGAYGTGTAGFIVGTNLDALVSSRSSHSAADVWAVGTRRLSDGTNIVLAKGVGVTGFNDLSAAQVESEVNDALVVHRLDELLNADSDIDGAAPPTVGSVFFELMTKTTGSFTFDQTTDSLEALRDRGDAAWLTATGFSTHSAADVWAVGTRRLSDGTNIVLAKGVGVTGFNDLSAAQVNAEVDAALVDINLDHLLFSAVATDFATTVHANSVIGHLADNGAGFDRATDSLEAIRDRGDAAWTTSTLTAAAIRAEMDANSTKLIDILADTNELEVDWTNGGRLDNILDAAALEATAQAIKAKTDLIPASPAAVGSAMTLTSGERTSIADALLDRNMATGTDSGSPSIRTVRQALRALRNKIEISGGTLTVYKEDDVTASHSAAVTTTASDPVTALEPAGP